MKTLFNSLMKFVPVLLFVVIWELVTKLELINNLFIPPFSEVLKTLFSLFASGIMLKHTGLSLLRAMGGFVIAVIAAIPLGVSISKAPSKLRTAIEPLLEIFCQVNPFILYHLIVLFLGYGEAAKVTIIAWTCTWPVLFSTASGIKNLDVDLIKAGRSFGAKGISIIFKVLLPAAMPSIFTGIRLSAGYSLFMLIAAEMMGASSGLGWLIINSQENYSITTIFSAVIVIAFLGLLIDIIMQRLEESFSYTV